MKLDHLFDWPSRHHVQLALPVMIVISVGLHIAGVAAFQVVHSRSHIAPERGARVFFLPRGSAEAARMAPILAAADPALFSPAQTFGRKVWNLAETTYTPSFDTKKPALASPPAAPTEALLPPLTTARPVSRNQLPTRSDTPAPGQATRVRLSGELADRPLTAPEGFSFTVVSADGLKRLGSTVFDLAVSPEGQPLYFFLNRSSGNETLDRTALRYLAGARLAPDNSDAPTWGTATFHWGNDVINREAP